MRRGLQQIDQAVQCIVAIHRLGTKPPRLNHQHPAVSHASSRQAPQPRLELVVKIFGLRNIKTQFDRARNLVHVLTAGSGRAHELPLQFAFGYRNLVCDENQFRLGPHKGNDAVGQKY